MGMNIVCLDLEGVLAPEIWVAFAEKAGIPVQVEAANGRTGTDGDVIHKTGQGVPFSLVSIPLRYMHTPAELGSLTDIDQCVELLARFLCDLDEGLDLTWY